MAQRSREQAPCFRVWRRKSRRTQASRGPRALRRIRPRHRPYRRTAHPAGCGYSHRLRLRHQRGRADRRGLLRRHSPGRNGAHRQDHHFRRLWTMDSILDRPRDQSAPRKISGPFHQRHAFRATENSPLHRHHRPQRRHHGVLRSRPNSSATPRLVFLSRPLRPHPGGRPHLSGWLPHRSGSCKEPIS